MSSYHYLAAQLPSITACSSGLPMSFEEFKELASRFLTEKDLTVLANLSLEPPRENFKTGSKFLDSWYIFERALRLYLQQLRAIALKWDAPISFEERESVSSEFSAAKIAQAAAAIKDPLEAEIFLDNARFDAADVVKGGEIFSSDGIFSYAIKLLLCERNKKFGMESGREEYSAIYSKILEEPEAAAN